MSKIRKLYYFDKKNMREMISFLNNRDKYINRIMFNPLIPLHHLLPLRFKFLPESYVMKDKKEIKGLITVAPSRSPMRQMEIQRLFFEENGYDIAGELIQYVVSKYKAMGAASFIVKVDDYLPELLKLFVSRCGFSQISYEKLWKINNVEEDFNKRIFRTFRNSDSPTVAALFNESLLPHFRPLLSRDAKEFKEIPFKGLSYFNEYKYVIEDKKSNTINKFNQKIAQEIPFLNYVPKIFISAVTHQRLNQIFTNVLEVQGERCKRISTGLLNKVVNEAYALNPPQTIRNKRLKIMYSTQTTVKPPTFVLFVNNEDLIKDHYKRYIENKLREAFGFTGTPIKILIRTRTEKK